MRRGQAGLEYIYIIGIVAAGLIGMIFYISRSHQGSLRSEADQLSESQYAPGKTEIHNTENKLLESTLDVTGIGSTLHSKDPQGEINEEAVKYSDLIAGTQMSLYKAVNDWEKAVVDECLKEAAKVRGGAWTWERPHQPTEHIEKNVIPPLLVNTKKYSEALQKAIDKWPPREKNKTSPGSPVRTEDGTRTTSRTTNEALGALGALGEE